MNKMNTNFVPIVIKLSIIYRTTTLKPLVSREKEIEWMENFLITHLDKEESASLYISGQPGTGKTACLSYILQLPKVRTIHFFRISLNSAYSRMDGVPPFG